MILIFVCMSFFIVTLWITIQSLLMKNKIYNLDYDRHEKEDAELVQLMKNDEQHGT